MDMVVKNNKKNIYPDVIAKVIKTEFILNWWAKL